MSNTPANLNANVGPVKSTLALLASGAAREQIITTLCQKHGMKWGEAEELLLDIEIGQPRLPSGNMLFVVTGLVAILVGVLFLAAYLVGSSLIGPDSSPPGMGVAFVAGISVGLLAVFVFSLLENATREHYRCTDCHYLSNRLGDEREIFLPLYGPATYHTYEKRTSTHHNTWHTWEGEGWNSYGVFQVTKLCRRCRRIREQTEESRKVSKYRPKNQNNDPYW